MNEDYDDWVERLDPHARHRAKGPNGYVSMETMATVADRLAGPDS